MTGYGEGSAQGEGWRVSVKVKSLNHRYLEIYLRGLEDYPELDLRVRDLVQRRFARGRMEISLKLECLGEEALRFDPEAVRPYWEGLRKLAEALGLEEPSLDHLLRLGALRPEPPDPEGLWPVLQEALEEALEAVEEMRRREGEALAQELLELLRNLTDEIEAVAERAPQLKEYYRERLRQRVEELGVEVDPERLEQEVVLYAERIDITEELARLRIHCEAAERLIRSQDRDGEAIGRELDFLAQEMNREANTIASKAREGEIAQRVVTMKALIERFREQVRNVE
jgi:uncharacterized protein (TIGR00255 family)